MRSIDIFHLANGTLRGYPTRTFLMIVAMSIGVAAVVILTSLGEGARRYIVNEFSSLGTNLIIVLPGRSETTGSAPGILMGQTPRDLTLEDALALQRIHTVRRLAPLTVGSAVVSWGRRNREVPVVGSTSEFINIRQMQMAQGNFLPPGAPQRATPVIVLGNKVRDELFGAEPALGKWLRVGDRRFRVIGVIAKQGQSLGFNTDELVIVPVASAQMLFNTNSLFRIMIEARSRDEIQQARTEVMETITKRHEGELDVTVVTQDAVLATFDRVLRALTLAVAGIAAISLAVAGILIMNVMLIAISQRTKEIGLLKAIGATRAQIRWLFFSEAALLSIIGALFGLMLGEAGSYAIRKLFPVFPAMAPWWAVTAAVLTALVTGILFSLLPAKRAARLDPVTALARR